MAISKPNWHLSEHSKGKHEILSHYLDAWLPTLGKSQRRLLYIDGFAGPGEYKDGEKGSPLIAIERIREYLHEWPTRRNEVVCLFLEEDKKIATHLESVLEERGVASMQNLRVSVRNEKFDDVITRILDTLETVSGTLAPSFTMIDPFGIKGVRHETIKRILNQPKSECMITFMEETINRFKDTREFQPHLEALFGTDDLGLSEADSDLLHPRESLRQKFVKALKDCGSKYVLPFKIWRESRHLYTIFFATSNPVGCDKMKQSMWKVDESGSYSFKNIDSRLDIFVQSGVDSVKEPFRVDLVKEYGTDSWIPIEVIENFAKGDRTHFHSGQLKRKTLIPLESENRILVDRPKGGRWFPPNKGIRVKFKV